MNDDGFFETSDICLVAALLCIGAGISVVDQSNPKRAVFHFRREKGLDNVIKAFWTHKLQVDPIHYFNSLKEAKTRLYADHR